MTGRTRVRIGTMMAIAVPMAIFASTPALSQDGQAAPKANGYLESLKACQRLSEPGARLSCFDSAAATMVEASEAGDMKIVDRQDVRETRRKLFGFSLPDLGIFGGGDDKQDEEDEFEQIETTIAAVSGSHATGYLLRTAEGAVWRIDDVPRRLLTPEVGDKLLIKNGALTSFFLRINDRGGVKGVRVR